MNRTSSFSHNKILTTARHRIKLLLATLTSHENTPNPYPASLPAPKHAPRRLNFGLAEREILAHARSGCSGLGQNRPSYLLSRTFWWR